LAVLAAALAVLLALALAVPPERADCPRDVPPERLARSLGAAGAVVANTMADAAAPSAKNDIFLMTILPYGNLPSFFIN
jgi:hypothetical protein